MVQGPARAYWAVLSAGLAGCADTAPRPTMTSAGLLRGHVGGAHLAMSARG